jgi:hypothetical protein
MLTKLEIINDMLASVGTAALSSSNTMHPSYSKANLKLAKESRLMQGLGWWFNKFTRTARPNAKGEIVLPANALHADPLDTSTGYVVRGGKLFDPATFSFSIGTDVVLRYVENVAIEDLPPTAAAYLQARAVYAFYVDSNGGDPKLGEYRTAMVSAWGFVRQEDLRNKDLNIFDGQSMQQFRRVPGAYRLPR